MLEYIFSFILVILVSGIFAVVCKVRSMRVVDRVSAAIELGKKTGFFSLLKFIGVDIRAPCEELTAPNGLKLHMIADGTFTTLNEVHSFSVRSDDIFIATYPKSGTTWMQEMVWLICHNVDIESAKKTELNQRVPFMELVDVPGPACGGLQTLERWGNDKRRIIKTHLPFEFLPQKVWESENTKLIYVARNPKDICVSYFYFLLAFECLPNPGTWNQFFEKFIRGTVPWGSWFSHCLKYWEEHKKRKKQIHFVTYEALKKDMRSEIVSLARFIGKELTNDQISAIAQHCTFQSMSKNPVTNRSSEKSGGFNFQISKFMRKGEIGDWKNHFTINQNLIFDDLYERNMKDTDLIFEFD